MPKVSLVILGQSINLMSRAISLTTIIIIIIIIVIIIIIIVIIIILLFLLFYYFIIIMKIMKFFMFYIISFLQIAYGFCIGALFKWYPGMILWFFCVCVDVHVCQFWTTTSAILVCFSKFSTSLRVNIIYLSTECVTKFWHCRWMVFMKLKSI